MKKKKKSEGGGRIRELFRRPQRIDYSLLAILMSLICFGLLMLYSTSSYSASMHYGKGTYYFGKQAFFCVLGFGVMMLFSCVRYQKLGMAKYKLLLYWGSIAAMALVWTPLGIEVNGARRWITVGIGQLQPSELAKVAVILVIPALPEGKQDTVAGGVPEDHRDRRNSGACSLQDHTKSQCSDHHRRHCRCDDLCDPS